ncbi:YraN family protein [Roseobacteraceae bacterium S113]
MPDTIFAKGRSSWNDGGALDLFSYAETFRAPTLRPQGNDVQRSKRAKGQRNYCAGMSAEANVIRAYEARGAHLLCQRFRAAGGEIDLIFRAGAEYVFVEVKASRTFDDAMARITPSQMRRIYKTAEAYLSTMPEGQNAEMRFDAGLVDQQGAVQIIEGALLLY